MMFKLFHPLLVLLLTLTWVRAAEIQQTRWGFDGKVVPEHFNQLSLLVYNADSKPFDGVLELTEGTLIQQGAPWRVACYLAPGTSRWVQFQPWIANRTNKFTLRSLPGGGTSEIDEPEFSAPATVMLSHTNRLELTQNAFKKLPAELFPISTLATDGLACLIMDHVPRWQPAQRQAFRDWLWRGGTVFIISAIDGSTPRFTSELDFLNSPAATLTQKSIPQTFGAGVVFHYHGEPGEFGPETLLSNNFITPTLNEDKSHFPTFTRDIFQKLTQMVKPNHPWAIIYLLLIVYLILIGPGAWLAARKGVNYRTLNIGIGAVIVGSVALIWFVGQRGYGERASLTSIAYAHALGDGNFATTQWASCFVTSSDTYQLSHPGNNNLFACPNENEKVNALITNDDTGNQLSASIPLYSSRSFVHGGRLQFANFEPRVQTFATTNNEVVENLTIILSGMSASGINWSDLCSGAKVHYRGKIYTLERSGHTFTKIGSAQSIEDFSNDVIKTNSLNNYDFGYNNEDDGPANQTISHLNRYFSPLIAYSLGGHGVIREWSAPRHHDDHVSLFLLLDQAPNFQVSSGITQQGRVVVRFDLPVAAGKTP